MAAYNGNAMRIDGLRYPAVVNLEGLEIPSQRRLVRFGRGMYVEIGHM